MIEIHRLAAQGDVLFRRIPKLPEGAVERPIDGPIVVAHSETGHHHAIEDAGVRLFELPVPDAMISFLSVDGPFADVVHHRPHDTHETLRLSSGTWEVRRQREWSPEEPRRIED
jgi:hypothetical protein